MSESPWLIAALWVGLAGLMAIKAPVLIRVFLVYQAAQKRLPFRRRGDDPPEKKILGPVALWRAGASLQ